MTSLAAYANEVLLINHGLSYDELENVWVNNVFSKYGKNIQS